MLQSASPQGAALNPFAVFAWPLCNIFQALFTVCKALDVAFLPSQLWVGLLREGSLQNCCDMFFVNSEDGACDCVVYTVLGQQKCSRVSIVWYFLSGEKNEIRADEVSWNA